MGFIFNSKAEIHHSDDFIQSVEKILDIHGAKKTGMMVDAQVYETLPRVRELANRLKARGSLILDQFNSFEPTTDAVDEHAVLFRGKSVEMLIGIGGGSTLDLAKAVSVMACHEGKTEDFHGTGKPLQASIKKILIPTTAGTGSEVTPGAVLVNTRTKFKRALGGPLVCAEYAVLDPSLTLSMPTSVVAATGLDALTHSIEGYTTKCSNSVTSMYARTAFGMVYRGLQRVFSEPTNLETRRQLLLGSALAGYAIYNSNTGACHSMAYPLGIYQKIPHGVAVGFIIPKVMTINLEKGYFGYSDLLTEIEPDFKSQDRKIRSERLVSLVSALPAYGAFEKTFADYGVNAENYKFLAERGLDLTPALSNNPVEFGLNDSERVLKELIHL